VALHEIFNQVEGVHDPFFPFAHRALAAFRASALRSSSLIAAKRTLAPRPAAAFPPSRPSATAAGFFFGFAMRRILASGALRTRCLKYQYRYWHTCQ